MKKIIILIVISVIIGQFFITETTVNAQRIDCDTEACKTIILPGGNVNETTYYYNTIGIAVVAVFIVIISALLFLVIKNKKHKIFIIIGGIVLLLTIATVIYYQDYFWGKHMKPNLVFDYDSKTCDGDEQKTIYKEGKFIQSWQGNTLTIDTAYNLNSCSEISADFILSGNDLKLYIQEWGGWCWCGGLRELKFKFSPVKKLRYNITLELVENYGVTYQETRRQ